jgi:MFS family permease
VIRVPAANKGLCCDARREAALIAARAQRFPLLRPLALRDFRLLWFGESVSVFGDQFYLVALPWLVLQLTGSSIALGTVLVTAVIPRGALVLLGGAIADRVSPRLLMLASNACRAALVATVGALVLLHHAQLWQLYVLAFLFGVADAVFYPAAGIMAPLLVDEQRLAGANALLMATTQMSGLIGPALAGIVIASLSPVQGIGTALWVDAGTFVVSAASLAAMRPMPPRSESPASGTRMGQGLGAGLHRSLVTGLRYTWADPLLRALLLVSLVANFASSGAFAVGIPVLARTRFTHGAAALGFLLSAFSGGGLAGTALGGSRERPPHRGRTVIVLLFCFSAGLALLASVQALGAAVVILAAMGLGNGFNNVLLVTWVQVQTDRAMLGRVMSLFSLVNVGLTPLAIVLAGVLSAINPALTFAASAAAMFAAALATVASKTVRSVA